MPNILIIDEALTDARRIAEMSKAMKKSSLREEISIIGRKRKVETVNEIAYLYEKAMRGNFSFSQEVDIDD